MEQKERSLSGSSSQQDPSLIFQLAMEQKLQCVECQGVRYSQAKENCLHLFIPAKKIVGDAADEKWEPISLEKCLQHYFDGSIGEGWSCPTDKKKTNVVRSSKLYSCPKVLTLVMKRFVMGENYVMKKLSKEEIKSNGGLIGYNCWLLLFFSK
jgi:ubiquitin carboxyl-terminal hydrolase 5/13